MKSNLFSRAVAAVPIALGARIILKVHGSFLSKAKPPAISNAKSALATFNNALSSILANDNLSPSMTLLMLMLLKTQLMVYKGVIRGTVSSGAKSEYAAGAGLLVTFEVQLNIAIETYKSKVEEKADDEVLGDRLAPGTGSIGEKGTILLIDYEDLGEDYMVKENGILVAIRSRDVEGKGNITYGYGILFKNTPEEIKRLKDTYGLEFKEGEIVPIAKCESMYQDYVNENLPALHTFTKEEQIWLNQNQMDALIMHRHLAYRLGSNTQDLLKEMFDNEDLSDSDLNLQYRDKLFNALFDDLADKYKNDEGEFDSEAAEKEFNRFKDGWTNRILDEVELFFDGDEIRNH